MPDSSPVQSLNMLFLNFGKIKDFQEKYFIHIDMYRCISRLRYESELVKYFAD